MSDLRFDPNRIVVETITELTKDFVISARKEIAALFGTQIATPLITFERYIQQTYNRCSTVRILIDKDKIYSLEDVYVQGKYKCSDKYYFDNDVATMVRDSGKIVVQGFGGIGKTILLKYIWCSIFKSSEGKIPVFIELKRLNEISRINLKSYMRATLSSGIRGFSEEQFEILCESGRFIFLFDAFDEVNDERRDEVEREILSLAYEYPDCGLLVSSRKDRRFESWEQFTHCHALPFDRKQIEEVIKRVDFDKEVRKKFISNVLATQYEKYESFLSTPLLALIMLMTYRQFADIPEKVHIFYKYAFMTLYSLHDGSKESFNRARKTNLTEDEFCKIFSIFCILSYSRLQVSFGIEVLRDYIRIAIEKSFISVEVDKFIAEAIESVNLLYQEGNVVSFVHRSLQEYFAAFALINVYQNRLIEAIDGINHRPNDTMLLMAYEMNSDLIEDNYIVPKYISYRDTLSRIIDADEVIDVLKILGCQWVFFLLNRNGPELMQHGAYFRSDMVDFVSSAGHCLSADYRLSVDFTEDKDADANIVALGKALCDSMPSSRSSRKRPLIAIVDFAHDRVTYDATDGKQVPLPTAKAKRLIASALQCDSYLRIRIEQITSAFSELQEQMIDILKRAEQRKSKSIFDL